VHEDPPDEGATVKQKQRERRLPAVDDPHRYQFLERPRCTACGSIRAEKYHTTREGKGEQEELSHHMRCLACGGRWIVNWE
jgi:hypothetical protein